MSNVYSLSQRRAHAAPKPIQPARPRAPLGGDVYLVRGGTRSCPVWAVFDESPSGGSAGSHGDFTDRDEAIREGRKLAEEIGGVFHEGSAA